MKKAIFLSLILFTGIPISCLWEPQPAAILKVEELEVRSGQFQTEDDVFTFREEVFRSGSDTLSSDRLVLELSVTRTSVVASASSLWTMNAVYADPLPPKSESKLALISIYADEPVVAGVSQFAAGENLTNLFLANSLYTQEETTVLRFIEQQEEWLTEDIMFLYLADALDQPLASSLRVDVTLEDGRVFNLVTDTIVVK